LAVGLLLAGADAQAQESRWRWFWQKPKPAPVEVGTPLPVLPSMSAGQPGTIQFTKPVEAPTPDPTARTMQFTKPADPAAPALGLPRLPEMAVPATAALLPAAAQQPQPQPGAMGTLRAPGEDSTDYQIQLEPPGPQRLFRLESEASLQERMRQEARERPSPERILFPEEPILSRDAYAGRSWSPMSEHAEPNYVCHKRLYFEQLNAERYGWDLGILHPLLATGKFYWDVATYPYHAATAPCRKFECSAGYCLPGDPVPLLLYPPEFSWTGLAAQGAVIGGLYALIP
jgi:hypothetical protein